MLARKFVVMVALVAMVSASCGDSEEDVAAPRDEPKEAQPGRVTVEVDAKSEKTKAFNLAYFPGEVKVHPGDTVVYKSNFTGEPHTITFGSLITPAITAVEKATPEQLASDEPPPEFEALFPYAMLPEGPGDANQVSANPCFVASGALPTDTTKPCEVREPAPFTGKEVFYNSGFLADEAEFEIKLADDIAPGTYKGFCMLHFTEMVSTITVVAEDQEVPSSAEVAAEAKQQQQALAQKAGESATKAKSATKAGEVLAGDPAPAEGEEEAPPSANSAFGLAEFSPGDVSIPAGQSITWNINGPHSITFNAPEDARIIIGKGPDGFTHLIEKAAAPALFPVPPPPEEEPEGPPPTVDLGAYDGVGFASTGIQFGGAFKITFTKPGTFAYICVVHPDMKGTVTVT